MFLTTHWSVILSAGDSQCMEKDRAIESICNSYWYPLYAFVRRSGFSPEDASDLTQGFFEHLLSKKIHQQADPSRGRFRTFLLTSLKNHIAKHIRDAGRQKRGGGIDHISLNLQDAEGRYLNEPVHELAPDLLYDRAWANTLLERSLLRLKQEHGRAGQAERFNVLSVHLVEPDQCQSYADLASSLSMSEGAVKTAMHRLRKRFRDIYREEIHAIVGEESELEDEMRHLLCAL